MQINKQAVALPYKKYGLQVYESGINYVVDIPELDALISYNGLSFAIRLPYRLFGNNTKGQCGELPTGSGRCPVEGGGQSLGMSARRPAWLSHSSAQGPVGSGTWGPQGCWGGWHPLTLGAGALPTCCPGLGVCGTLTGVRCCLGPGPGQRVTGQLRWGAEGSAWVSRCRRHVHQQHGGRLCAAQR